jgi:hypothetical protein
MALEIGRGGAAVDDFANVYLEDGTGLIPVARIPRDGNASPGDLIHIVFRGKPLTLEIIEVIRHRSPTQILSGPAKVSFIARRPLKKP